MDVTDTTARRDADSLRQLLRERDDEHAREVEGIREDSRKQISDLEANQSESLKDARERHETEQKKIRDDFDNKVDKLSDRYERNLKQERSDAYDKYGRLQSEKLNEGNRERDLRNKQITELEKSHASSMASEKERNAQTEDELRSKHYNSMREREAEYMKKLGENKDYSADEIAKASMDAREKIDDHTRRTRDEFDKQRLGAELRYTALSEESNREREGLVAGHKARETQLIDEKNNAHNRLSTANTKAYEDYRRRSADELAKNISDAQFLAAEKERRHAADIMRLEQDNRLREQALKTRFERAEDVLKSINQTEKDRADLKESLGERRHAQDLYLNLEATRRAHDLDNEIMKQHFNDQIRDIESKGERQNQERTRAVQHQMGEYEIRMADELNNLHRGTADEARLERLRHESEMSHVKRTYEDNREALEDLRRRQLDDQNAYYANELRASRADVSKTIEENNRENQGKVYMAQTELTNRTAELEAQRQVELRQAESSYGERAKRISENYARNLSATKDSFDDAISEHRHAAQLTATKQRVDAEHEKRVQLIELKAMNRDQLIAFESRLNRIKDEHEDELNKLKSDNDKALRDVIKKTKEELDGQQLLHSRELEARDVQMKEKLRLQDEAFKEQIDKLKRSHELTINKSKG
jgi:hypothetical protein